MTRYSSIHDLKSAAAQALPSDVYEYLTGGAEDFRTGERNIAAYQHWQLRPRRLVDVRQVDTSFEIFGEKWPVPVMLAPVGLQAGFHPDGEIATARAAQAKGWQMGVSTVSNFSYAEIAAEMQRKPWFQLYPTTNRAVTETLVRRAEDHGCPVLVLTVDVPVLGNRQKHRAHLVAATTEGKIRMGNLEGANGHEMFNDPGMTWDIIAWLRQNCKMKIVLKGILTAEDAHLAVQHGVDGIWVSNHGGRQLESDLSTLEALPEIVGTVRGQVPILLDGGIRRGTDVLKALALGADAVCLGRAFCYGLAANGQAGVERVLEIFEDEIERDMQLLGVTRLRDLGGDFLREKRW